MKKSQNPRVYTPFSVVFRPSPECSHEFPNQAVPDSSIKLRDMLTRGGFVSVAKELRHDSDDGPLSHDSIVLSENMDVFEMRAVVDLLNDRIAAREKPTESARKSDDEGEGKPPKGGSGADDSEGAAKPEV